MTDSPKTKSLGSITADKAKKIAGWADYERSAKALMEARKTSQAAKLKVKEALKRSLKETGDLDFTVETNGTVRVFLNLVERKRQTRTSGPDLSDKI